jgi:hypothetical protein
MRKSCFVITPIGAAESPQRQHADRVWEQVLKPVFDEAGYELIRADKMTDPGQITEAIFRSISESDVCVADLSFLNPNVMYELGVRHCLRLPTIQIKSESTPNPFDTKNQRTIDFDLDSDESLTALSADIRNQLDWIERNPGNVSNPLTSAIGRFQADFDAERTAKSLSTLARRVTELEANANLPANAVAAAIAGQGDLATMNLKEIKDVIGHELQADAIDWRKSEDGSVTGQFKGFDITLRPQSKERWSSSAVHHRTGYSVSYPTWRNSEDAAKKAILEAMLNEAEYWNQE